MECKFCEEFEWSKGNRKRIKESTGCNIHIKACLFEYWTKNGQRRSTHIHRSRPLNYCPECGKKLKGAR